MLVAELRGITDEKIATIIAGQRSDDLTREEGSAYDLASSGLRYLVGLYCMVPVTLNGFDVPVPEIGKTSRS